MLHGNKSLRARTVFNHKGYIAVFTCDFSHFTGHEIDGRSGFGMDDNANGFGGVGFSLTNAQVQITKKSEVANKDDSGNGIFHFHP